MIERMTDLHPVPHANYGVALVSILITAHILLNPEYRSILIDILKKNFIWIVGLSCVLALNAQAFAVEPLNVLATRSGIFAGGQKISQSDANCSGHGSLTMGSNGAPGVGKPVMPGQDNGSIVTGTYAYCYDGYTYNYVDVCPSGTLSITQVGGTWYCQVPNDPCKSKSGMDVDDGTVDFGDGANKRLSMVFTAKASDDYVGTSFCSGGCQASVTKEVGGGGVTINGKYAGTFNAKFSGVACNAGQQNADKKTDPGLLPKDSDEKKCVDKGMGFGYVNEKVMCVPADKTNSTEKKTGETTKPDGSRTTESKTDKTICSGGVCTTTTTTITTEYNSSGTATGTTTKTETTSKPDPNAAVSGNGSGGGGEGAECGIPGKPPCSVKVDETGTPSDISGINSNKTALETAMDQIKEKFGEVSQPKQWSVVWNYQLPSGACSPLQFGGQRFSTSLDICKPLGYVRDLWSYVISFLTGLYIWRSCRDALNLT